VAGIVAAHGLLSKGIALLGLPDAGPHPVSVAFETMDAVDDIVIELSDGTRVYMQAKRIYGDDSTFESAVRQLVSMLDDLQDGDRLVVVSADARGNVKELPEALRVRRAEGVLKSTHQKALDALAKRVGLSRGSTRFEKFCDAVYAWHVSADSAEDGGYQLSAALLDNTVVETPHGAAAFGVLLARMHSEAGSASRSRIDDWWAWLNDARLPLLAGSNGLAAQRLTVERDAMGRYRRRLSSRKDMVEFALISDDHPPVRVPDMLASIRVARSAESDTGYDLMEAVRRHQHVVLLGLPGAGKTSAVVQLAAHLAEDRDAPLPIFTKLQRACRAINDAHDITIPLLVNDAIRNAPEQERAILAEVLARELTAGCALLICDGLDECGSRASTVADGLARLREGFSPDVGLVVTTRPSSSGPARKLALRESWLTKPIRGDAVQRQILDSVMARLKLTDEQRTARRAKLKQVQSDQPEIARIPLLGNLIALLVGVGRDTHSADTVADILEKAVEQSLSRWEAHRSRAGSSDEPTASLLSNGLLWDGFIEIGRLLAREPICTRSDATARVEEVLVEHWSKGTRDAQALAPHVVNFWDAAISVFVEDHTGVLTARSRVFADLADALWVSRSSNSAKVEWIRESVIHENRYENFLLACMKVPDLPDLAMSVVDDTDAKRRLVQWLCDAAAEITLSDSAISGVLDHLAAEAHRTADWIPQRVEAAYPEGASPQERQKLKDGHAWPFVRKAAALPLPPHLRARRDALIAEIRSDPERAYTAITLASTTDAQLDSRLLNQNEISALTSLLALPRPVADDRLVQTARHRYAIRPVEPMISGRAEAMLRATRCLDQLPDGSAEKVVGLIKSTTEDNAIKIEFELEKHGYRGPLSEQLADFKLPRSLTACRVSSRGLATGLGIYSR
jgi:NACHT domain